MPPMGFEPTISAGERPQTYALDRAATGTGCFISVLLGKTNGRSLGTFKQSDVLSGIWKSVGQKSIFTHTVCKMSNTKMFP